MSQLFCAEGLGMSNHGRTFELVTRHNGSIGSKDPRNNIEPIVDPHRPIQILPKPQEKEEATS